MMPVVKWPTAEKKVVVEALSPMPLLRRSRTLR
jgi:hypothetical protein